MARSKSARSSRSARSVRRSARPEIVRPGVVPPVAGRDVSPWALAAVLVAAAGLRVALLTGLAGHELLEPRAGLDNAVYLDLARAIAAGDFAGGAGVYFVSPFYLYFAALVLSIGDGSIVALQAAQVALGVAAVWLIADTARLWYGRAGAVVAGALAALTGIFAFNEVLVLQSSVDVFLTALGLWLLARAWLHGTPRVYAAAGVVLGLHVLNRPNIGLWAVAAVLLTAAFAGRDDRPAHEPRRVPGVRFGRDGFTRAGWLAAGLALALTPVAVRNLAVAGELALVSSHGGLNFYIGNHEGATGTYQEVPGISATIAGQSTDMQRVAGEALGRPVSDVEASRYFHGRAWDWIGAHPRDAAALFARKIAYTFNATDIALNDSFSYFARDEDTALRLMPVGPWLLVPLGLAGLVLGRPRQGPPADAWWRWAAFVVVYAVAVAVFFVAGRYRLPLLVALCVTSAGALLALWRLALASDWRRLAGAGGAIAALAIAANLDLGLDDGRAGWRAEAIVRAIEDGRSGEAEAAIIALEPDFPNPGLLRYRTARAYLARGDRAAAMPHLERAAALAPQQADVRLDLGQALLAAGEAERAEPHLAAAVAAQPDNALARGLLGMTLGRLGRADAALVEFEAAVSLDPADPAAHLNLGVAYAQAGRLAEARVHAETALRLRPDYERARVFLDAVRGRS